MSPQDLESMVDGMVKNFEKYQDKVSELESICDAHVKLVERLVEEKETLMETIKIIKYYALDGELAKILEVLDKVE